MNAQLKPGPEFDVLGLVTSAGGLQAMSAVLSELPPDFHAAVVVGQHLGSESSLVDILQRRVRLPVRWANGGDRLQAGTIHLGRPLMQVEVLPDLTLHLSPITGETLKVKPLDALLRSLAHSCGRRAMAVVLTGMGKDGAAGALAIKQAGGTVLVEDEATAAFPDMPRAAAEAGAADLVLPLNDIGRVVAQVVAGAPFPVARNEGEAREALFAGAGPAREALRKVEWSAGPLGPVMQWPPAMRAVVAALLTSPMPACVAWGDDLIQIYNDAWVALLGDAHPQAAGRPARATWLGPGAAFIDACAAVLQSGQTREGRDELYEPVVSGRPVEKHFTLAHSALADTAGRPLAVMTIANETTDSVLAHRRLLVLRALAAGSAGSDNVLAACERAAAVLAQHPRDVPFALLYMIDSAGQRANLCSAAGLREGSPAAPHTVDVFSVDEGWPIGRALRHASPIHLAELPSSLRGVQLGPWSESASAAMVLPIRVEGERPFGAVVLGLSPRVPLAAAYRDFLETVARQVTANIGAAQLRERDRTRVTQLSELDRSRTEFFSNVSHEFRTPLTLILGPLEDLLLSSDESLMPLRRELEVVSRNAVRLLNLVDTLLDFSQLEAGRLKARFEPTDLSELTRDIAALFRSAAERAGLTLEVDCPPAPGDVRVDRGMWEKIVSNLLSNALKFTFEGGITLRLRYMPQHVQLEVIDTGVGIPEEELPHVFRRFHRVQGTRARTNEGTGIGLSMVDELARLHYGRVRVHSRVGEGSTFTVWVNLHLPQAHAEAAGAPQAQRRSVAQQLARDAMQWLDGGEVPAGVQESVLGPASAAPLLAAGARVLVVDDNVDMRDYLARTLASRWRVAAAADGREALELARGSPPDLILADVMMPGMNGFELLSELRRDFALRATPVVLVTARAHEEAAIEGLLAGADDYVAKPFSSRELVARVGAQLELARVRRHGERQLRQRNEELQRFNDAMVGRELRMRELKQEVNALLLRLGAPARYGVPDAQDEGKAP